MTPNATTLAESFLDDLPVPRTPYETVEKLAQTIQDTI